MADAPPPAAWTGPDALADQVRARWRRGTILSARVTGERLFPLELRLKRPGARDVANHFGAVMEWVQELKAGSRERRGFGYDLRWRTVRNRVQGSNDLPSGAVVPTEADALRLIGRHGDAERFSAVADTTLIRFPALRDWLARRPLKVLDHTEEWESVLAVLGWFRAHPRTGLYLRQLDIPGVDTKFIEARRGLLSELLDKVLPEEAVDPSARGASGFLQRYGLRSEPPLVRFRLLDRGMRLHGLEDLSVPAEEFATLRLPLRRVFITENRTNGLAFPEHPGSLVVFGLGYGLEQLAEVEWMRELAVYYWGDVDTHGFGILNRLRGYLPHARSFLMDRETLRAHRALWGQEPSGKRYTGEPTRLTEAERDLFEELRHDRLGERVRLEQERIGYSFVERSLIRL